MTKITNLIFFLLFYMSISTCIDEIDFEEATTVENVISIQGRLTKGNPSVARVLLKNTFDFTNSPRFIEAKLVSIIDENGNAINLQSTQQGLYEVQIPANHPTFKINYGRAYKLYIELFDNQIYESAYDTLVAVPQLADLSFQPIQKEVFNAEKNIEIKRLLSFNISTPTTTSINAKKSYFLWEIESVFKQSDSPTNGAGCVAPSCLKTSQEPKTCYRTFSPAQNYSVLDGNSLAGDFIENYNLFVDDAISGTYAEGCYLTVYQQSLSPKAFEYWSKVNLIVNRTGSQLEGPVGKVPTNFTNLTTPPNEVFGYFFCTESSFKRIFVPPSLADYPRPTCPPPPTNGDNPSGRLAICCNCLCQPNSSTIKPDWWVD